MRFVLPTVLLLLAIIHALPLLGVLGGPRLASLYGLGPLDANLEILLRHRAVLFGLLALFLAYAAFRRPLQGLALLAAGISVLSFIGVALQVGGYGAAIATVVRVDVFAAALVAVGALALWRQA